MFPDDFKDAIPENALALIMACVSESILLFLLCLILLKIYNCLDEYMIDGTQNVVSFEDTEYMTTYEAMLDLIENIKTHPYHGNKWEENRRLWA